MQRDILEMLMISLLSSLRSVQTCFDMADSAVINEAILRRLMRLERGLPNRDAFSRLFRTTDSSPFATGWAKALEAGGRSRSTARCSGAPSRAPRSSRRCISRTVFQKSANPNFTVPPTSGCAPCQCGRSGGGSGLLLRSEATRRNRRRGGLERPE